MTYFNPLDLTDEELEKLTQGVSKSMANQGRILANLQTWSDQDLNNLILRIQEEQQRRKWENIYSIIRENFFGLSAAELRKIQDYIQAEIQRREGGNCQTNDPPANDFQGNDFPANDFVEAPGYGGKDKLTGQVRTWPTQSPTPNDPVMNDPVIDVQASTAS
jgi:hypothetical protein